MADNGIKVLKQNKKLGTQPLKDYFLNSEKQLLKIHKQGAFKFLVFRFTGQTVTVQFNELGYRPLVLVYCQRFTHDATPVVDQHIIYSIGHILVQQK